MMSNEIFTFSTHFTQNFKVKMSLHIKIKYPLRFLENIYYKVSFAI